MPIDRTIRVYVAGAYSGPDVLAVLGNIRRGLRAGYAVQKAGFAAFVPWTDWLLHLAEWGPDEEAMQLDDYYRMSAAWLEVSDAVIVVPQGAEYSRGTAAELERAGVLGIPVFWEATVEESIAKAKAHFAALENDTPVASGVLLDPNYPWQIIRKSDGAVMAAFADSRVADEYRRGVAGFRELPGVASDYYVQGPG